MAISDLFDTFINAFTKDDDIQDKKMCKVNFNSVKNSYLGYIEFYKRNYNKLDDEGKNELEALGWLLFDVYPMSKVFADKAQYYFSLYCKYKRLTSLEQDADKRIALEKKTKKLYDEYLYNKHWKEQFTKK